MRTKILRVDKNNFDKELLREAAEVIRQGGLVAFPTETVYGLGANVFDEEAVKKIFKAKGRPSDNPLIVHIADKGQIELLAQKIDTKAQLLIDRFMPGPLTIILPKKSTVPDIVTAGLPTVAIRMPNHPVAKALIELCGVPIAAPSANLSGRPSPTSGKDVIDDLLGRVEYIIDAGETEIGLESTVIDLTEDPPLLLRPGAVTLEQLEEVLGLVEVYRAHRVDKPKSPGMKYRHYAPEALVIVVEGERQKVKQEIERQILGLKRLGYKIGVMTVDKEAVYNADIVRFIGDSYEEIARNIFRCFRVMDSLGVDVILVEGVSERGLGLAIMNRLRKASYKVIKV